MIHLRELFQLCRHALPSPTPPRRVARRRLPLGVIAVATFASGCADPSSRLADEPTVVDIDWTDGRTEISNPEVFADEHDGPVVLRIIKDGEIVQEFAEARFARRRPAGQASLQDVEDVADRPCRPDELPVLQLINHLKSAIPSSSDLDRLSPEGVDRVSVALEQLSEETLVCIKGLEELADSLTAATSSGSQ